MIPMISRSIRRGRRVAAFGLVALVAGCGGPGPAPVTPPRSRPATAVTSASPAAVVTSASPSAPALPEASGDYDVSGYRPVCGASGRRETFSGAAAYSGRGPHPIAFFGFGELARWLTGVFVAAEPGPVDKWIAKDLRKLQLVACVRGAVGKKIRSCGTYLGSAGRKTRVQMHWGEYTVDVYQARTAAPVVTGLRLRGQGESRCPTVLMGDDLPTSGVAKRITDLTHAQVVKALGRYVE